jgi:hypothetical protein
MTFFYDLNKRLANLGQQQTLTEGAVAEASYSAKAARAGKDIGKPGKNFEKIAKDAGQRYGSKAAGERVAGAVLNKLRGKNESQLNELSPELLKRARDAAGMKYAHADDRKDQKASDKYNRQDDKFNSALRKKQKDMDEGRVDDVSKSVKSIYYPDKARSPVQKFDKSTGRFDKYMGKNSPLDDKEYAPDQTSRPAGMNPDPASRYKIGEEGGIPMTAKQKSFAALAPPKDKITFADKIAGAKQEVEEMLGDVAAEAIKSALSPKQKKLDRNNNGKLDAQDFEMLRRGGKQETDEGFDDMISDVKKRMGPKVGDVKRGARHDIETTATGIRATRRHDDETDEQPTGEKRKAGRPKGADKGPERVTGKAYKHKGVRKTNEADLGNVAGYYKETQDVKKLTNWLEKNAGLPRNSPLYFDDVDLVYGDKTIVPGALVNPKLTFDDLLTAVVQALKQDMAEGDLDITDRGEYDQEGDMAKDSIKTVVRHAQALEKILGDNDNLPEWVQSKLAKIEGMMTAVDDYMQNQESDDEMAMDEEKTEESGLHWLRGDHKNPEKAGKKVTKDIEYDEKKKDGIQSFAQRLRSEDDRAERAGKKVTKDIEYDEKKKDGIHGKRRGSEDDKAEKAGKRVTKDIESDEKKKEKKVAETTTSGAVATGGDAPKASKGGMQIGKGIYDSLNREVEGMIAESMSINVSMTNDDNGSHKNITVTAADEDAEVLAQLLRSAGLGGSDMSHDHGHEEPCPDCGSTDCGCDEAVEEAYGDVTATQNEPNWPTDTEYNDDAMQYSGGLNKPKTDVAGDGQTTIPVTAVHTQDEDELRRMMEMAGIKQQDLKPWERTMKEAAVEEGVVDKVKDVVKKGLEKLGHGSDEDMRKDLQKKMGVPPTGKKPADKKMEESLMKEFANFKI